MIEPPKSLTAIIHISFRYKEAESEVATGRVEALNKLLECVSSLNPEHQELPIKFADCLQETCNKSG